MIRNKLRQFMVGRCGVDQLSLALLWASVLLQFVYALTHLMIFYYLSAIAIIVTFFRMFSRRLEQRRRENARFLALIRPVRQKFSTLTAHWKDKEHRYFRCPNCKQQMRVPRGKGRIRVTCRGCGITFEEKS